jgi:hypothetical protein
MIKTPAPVFIFCIFLFVTACSSGKRADVEKPPTPQATPAAPATSAINVEPERAAKLPEVQEAVKRVFKTAAVLHPDHNPNFVTGDFNGDSFQDLAVILKPDNVAEMNQEYPPWLLRDPRTNGVPQDLQVRKDEVLLAVIHGYGANAWRDPEATQTFVLKNAVGDDLKVKTSKEFVIANTGKRLPRPQGDLIAENLNGTAGYLYYAVSTYSWYDPRTFRPQTEDDARPRGKTAARSRTTARDRDHHG